MTTRGPNTGDRGSVVVAMALAQCPGRGGHAWAVLSYLLGFRRLGWRVTLLDRLPPSQCVDGAGRPVTPGRSVGYRYARAVLAPFGLAEDYVLLVDGDDEPLGRSRSDLVSDLTSADVLLDVMGFLDDPELRDAARCRAFLDIDPGFPQMWTATGLADVTADHDVHLTVGSGVGSGGCSVPTLGVHWRATLPPVVLDQWPMSLAPGRAVTSVVTWRGPFDPVDYTIGLDEGVRGWKIGLSLDFGHVKADSEVRALVEVAARRFEELGAHVEDVGPLLEPLQKNFEPLWSGSFAVRLRQIPTQLHGKLDPGFRALAEKGLAITLSDYARSYEAKSKLARDMKLWHEKYDLLLSPVTPTPPPPVETLYNSDAFPRFSKGAPYTLPFNLTGAPAASMPAGLTKSGLPVAIQIVGPARGDHLVLRAMRAYESALGWTWPQPRILETLSKL